MHTSSTMKRLTLAIASLVLLFSGFYSIAQQPSANFVPVTDEMLQNPNPADWLMWRRTLNGWGYSPLDQINRGNVRNLKLIWTRGMGPGVQEATPLVYRGVMYVPNPSDLIEAMNAATGEPIWEYKREWKEDVTKILPVPSINRNLAIFGNTIIDTSADDHVFALDATSGKLVWENRILDMKESPAQETSGPIIAKGKIFSGRGCEAKKSALACVIVAHDAKTGIVYTLDRQTGEFLWAKSTVMQNVVASIDGATGRATTNPETLFTAVGQTRFVCPPVNGGKNFQQGADSQLTNMMYYPLQNACANVTAIADSPSTFYAIQNNNQIAPGTDKIGTVQAISVETGKTVWKFEQRAGYMSLVATGGGLIFGGDANGHFRAFDQNTGSVLWDINLGSPVTGYPITYAVGGKQYVAVSTGNSLVSSGLNRLAPELHPSNASNVFVFALPE